ncbi:MAG: methyltransferase domain-containing protein [Bacteroidetes bacterium]|nr:methyltransferase domain-containing protein [Bacteroidota bacterium]
MSSDTKQDLNKRYLEKYTDEAKRYDQHRFHSTAGQITKKLRNGFFFEILRKYNLVAPDKKIIDVASGTGRVALELVTMGYKKVVATDLTNAMLDISRSKLPEQYKNNLDYHIADMKKLPFDSESFDGATMGAFFYLIPLEEYGPYVKDVHRVLKKEGILVCEVMNQLHLFNPVKFIGKFFHRHILGKKIKSHAYPWELQKAFAPFEVVDIIGTDFPYFLRMFGEKFINFLSKSSLTKYFGGRFVVALKK